jgi:hypothetical protein
MLSVNDVKRMFKPSISFVMIGQKQLRLQVLAEEKSGEIGARFEHPP